MFPEERSLDTIQPILRPWYASLEDPPGSQKRVLMNLVEKYEKTRYGKSHHASAIQDVTDFKTNFPIINYRTLNPYLTTIQKGDYTAILPEPLVCWVMTRGSTGLAKVLPATQTHLNQIFTCGARALVNYAVRKQDFEVLRGKILNLNFPSNVHTLVSNGQTVTYGYSSGTYAKRNPMLNTVSLVPRQEEIDALGSGLTKSAWERRFELVYRRALHENVTAIIGVTPVILSFARYVHRKHQKKPRDLWNLRALFCTSVRKIQFKYAPVIQRYFGQVPIVEIYSATEGVFAQQLDDLPYVTPNYDTYFFEVATQTGSKMLHELNRGEWGRLIVSSCLFPRYDQGDLIEAAGKSYFRVIGRYSKLTLLEHWLYRLFFRWAL